MLRFQNNFVTDDSRVQYRKYAPNESIEVAKADSIIVIVGYITYSLFLFVYIYFLLTSLYNTILNMQRKTESVF